MTYTPRKRDRYRLAAAAITGATTAKAERAQAKYDAAVARQQSRAEGPRIVYKKRPVKHRVSIQYVTGASTTSSQAGPGSTVTSSAPQQAPGAQPPNSGHQAPSSNPAPPPPPPPPPAPSSGS